MGSRRMGRRRMGGGIRRRKLFVEVVEGARGRKRERRMLSF